MKLSEIVNEALMNQPHRLSASKEMLYNAIERLDMLADELNLHDELIDFDTQLEVVEAYRIEVGMIKDTFEDLLELRNKIEEGEIFDENY